MKSPQPPAIEGTEQHTLDALIHGLAELLKAVGGVATVSEILEQLTSAGADAYPLLRSALVDFFPGLKPGDLPSPKLLGGRLRHCRGYVARGAYIDQVGARASTGMRWVVNREGRSSPPVVKPEGFRPALRPRAHLEVLHRTPAELVAALPRPPDEGFYEQLLDYDEDPDPTPESDRELVRAFLRRYDHGSGE